MISLSMENRMLGRRQILNDGGYYCDPDVDDCHSSWNDWGRWVALAVIIIFFVILAFTFSWLANRRRRRMGRQPFRGTGWVPYAGHPGFAGHPPPAYGQNAGTQPVYNNYPPPGAQYGGPQFGAPPPKYAGAPGEGVEAQQTGTTFTSGQGYYGGHGDSGQRGNDGGIELQSPPHAYQRDVERGDDYVYPPPAGSPPLKGEKV